MLLLLLNILKGQEGSGTGSAFPTLILSHLKNEGRIHDTIVVQLTQKSDKRALFIMQ